MYHPDEITRKTQKLKPPSRGHAFHVYVSAHNAGAVELLETLATHHSQQRGGAANGSLLWSSDAAQCWSCMHFVASQVTRGPLAGGWRHIP